MPQNNNVIATVTYYDTGRVDIVGSRFGLTRCWGSEWHDAVNKNRDELNKFCTETLGLSTGLYTHFDLAAAYADATTSGYGKNENSI